MRSRRLDVTSNNQVLNEMRSFQRHSLHTQRKQVRLTTVRHSWPLNRSVEGELPESARCTFVITAKETRRVDNDTSHVLHWVPYPREHNINTETAFSRVLNVTTEISTTLTQQKSCTHKLRHPETLRRCVPRNILRLRAKQRTMVQTH